MKKFLKSLKSPRLVLSFCLINYFKWLPDTVYIKLFYYAETGKCLNLKEPVLLNEKLQWLKLYNRCPEYTIYSDKVKVKEYIKNRFGEDIIIPTLGVWENAEDIDFNSLPDKFVIKCNHNSGMGMYICKDRSKMDEAKVRENLAQGLKENYFAKFREWSYKNIPRRIIAEQFLENADGTPIVDYKFYCYGGKPRYFMYSVGEANHTVRNCKFDMNCNNIDYLFKKKRALLDDEIKLPSNFNEMKAIVEKLCVGFPHIRVDLYNVDGKIYFGEMTFYSGAGFINIDNKEFSQQLADYIDISKIRRNNE